MARKPVKSSATTPRSSSKRAAPEPTSSRQSKRAKAGRKSYAEPDSDEGSSDNIKSSSHRKKKVGDDESDFEDANKNAEPSESEVGETNSGDDDDDDEDEQGAKRSALPSHGKKHVKGEELWRDGAKLEPGKQIIIKRPKAREAGNTPYTDETIHPNTMLFLKDLRSHNDRQWLKGINIILTTQNWPHCALY